MSKVGWFVLVLTMLVSVSFTAASVDAAEGDADARPNVIFILADDLGWSDTTLFETTDLYRTPNVERLAKRGMTFDRAYSSSPLCSPTRASVLTGLSPARHGITSPTCHLAKVVMERSLPKTAAPNRNTLMPTSVTRLDTSYYTLAEMFKDQGYTTGHFGKWHLGHEPYSPLEHGFDVDLPHHAGPGPAGSYVAPWKFSDFDHDPDVPNQHIEDRMALEAVDFMEASGDKPFFLNYWMFSVHAPFDAKAELIDEYSKIVDPASPQRSPTYAAMIESMDDAIGTLLDAVDKLGIADNTIIVFASDNGGNMYNYVDGGTATSNAPLKGGKATMYEGGVRGPAIVAYPGQIEAGSTSHEIVQSSDFYPTFLEMLSVDPQPGQEFDGVSLVPALEGSSLDREAIFTYFPHSPNVPEWLPPAVSVHRDDWKLIRIFHGDQNGTSHRYKLYNLADDIGENNDVSADHPELVAELDALIEEHLVSTQAVRPQPNPKYNPSLFDLSDEGKSPLKGGPNDKRKKKKRPKRKDAAALPAGSPAGQRHTFVSTQTKPNIIVVYTDDHGYSDLGAQGVYPDLKTPNIDALAAGGVRMTSGYCTAPQCVPSRGGLLSGQYQNRWGLESNPQFRDEETLRRFSQMQTIPERLQSAGYATGMAGKWHLGPEYADQIAAHGFDKAFHKKSNAPGHWNMNLEGEDVPAQEQKGGDYHINMISDFTCAFIDRYKDQPFFFYLACRAPHVPLDAPEEYLARFPGEMPERRRQALGMIAAIDDGVGQIMETLRRNDLEKDTLIFVISDNGAPLKIHKRDAPGGGPGWDGSLNEPMNGEKGMLTEGGIRVPFLAYWNGTIQGGQVFDDPVITLDVGATATALAGLAPDPALDGVNLIPFLTGETSKPPHSALFWRWLGQSAVRKDKWKYIRADDREYLFDLDADVSETTSLIDSYPDVAASMHEELRNWAEELTPPGIWAIKSNKMSKQSAKFFDHYIDSKVQQAESVTSAR